jgi:hypothetical protein
VLNGLPISRSWSSGTVSPKLGTEYGLFLMASVVRGNQGNCRGGDSPQPIPLNVPISTLILCFPR